MVARVADDLSRRIKAHRLRIEERRAEEISMMAFEPRRGIGDQRKRGRGAFRKAITAETLELSKGLLAILTFIAMGDHAGDQWVSTTA